MGTTRRAAIVSFWPSNASVMSHATPPAPVSASLMSAHVCQPVARLLSLLALQGQAAVSGQHAVSLAGSRDAPGVVTKACWALKMTRQMPCDRRLQACLQARGFGARGSTGHSRVLDCAGIVFSECSLSGPPCTQVRCTAGDAVAMLWLPIVRLVALHGKQACLR
jgi:hypothetical protein